MELVAQRHLCLLCLENRHDPSEWMLINCVSVTLMLSLIFQTHGATHKQRK